ncbi:hypothetical protein [Paenirhodobacter populi]|uniref:HTH cro/C1-type domain-containing protein n=1 Tax=Paenirhodobacter populi TaxID=2306993 RepID=A0A443J086_9RHOB|nr:hypothetical protein [Sinirhodobacter populi]RWR13796.1 hypothetical protein D2T33_05200 [Sinirhodobacter populi]
MSIENITFSFSGKIEISPADLEKIANAFETTVNPVQVVNTMEFPFSYSDFISDVKVNFEPVKSDLADYSQNWGKLMSILKDESRPNAIEAASSEIAELVKDLDADITTEQAEDHVHGILVKLRLLRKLNAPQDALNAANDAYVTALCSVLRSNLRQAQRAT